MFVGYDTTVSQKDSFLKVDLKKDYAMRRYIICQRVCSARVINATPLIL